MNSTCQIFRSLRMMFAILVAILTSTGVFVQAQCPVTELTSGLQRPLGIIQYNKNHLLVSESGSSLPNTGRISIVDLSGNRRTLLTGLPSGISFESAAASGPAGLFLRGNTLYLAIGVGDSVLAGPVSGTTVPNPSPSSPIFSSVLAIQLNADVVKKTAGFTLTTANHQSLAGGQTVSLSDDSNDQITVDLVANFPNFQPQPLPFFVGNVRNSNPFDLVTVGNQIYVTNGGENNVTRVDLQTGVFSTLVTFSPIPNPLPFGPPMVEAVPTGIAYSDGRLFVTLFRGFPFPPGMSVVEQIDPATGSHGPIIGGFKSGIDVLSLRHGGAAYVDPLELPTDDEDQDHDGEARPNEYLVLQHVSGPIMTGPGLLLRFEAPDSTSTVIAGCLDSPTSMTRDEKTGTLYITELVTGRVLVIHHATFKSIGKPKSPSGLQEGPKGRAGKN